MRFFQMINLAILAILFPFFAFAQEETSALGVFNQYFGEFVGILAKIFFYEIVGFPFVVLWLIIGGIFFTFRLSFPAFRLFFHAIDVVRGKYSNPDDPGQASHFQALTAAVAATVGLGNIAGVAIAVSVGGPGAVIWMMIAGFFGMSAKFAEVTLGHKYRQIDENGVVTGGAFMYLHKGLAELGMAKFGYILSMIFAFFCLGGAFGAGNMFQSNQAVKILTDSVGFLNDAEVILSAILAIGVGIILIGGFKRIAQVAGYMVPSMALLYILSCILILSLHLEQIPAAISLMFASAFDFEAIFGGAIGVIIWGFRRAAFSNEAGAGSAPIAHANARTKEPVRAGVVALLEPFLDTIVICFMTGIVIVTTGAYLDANGVAYGLARDGVLIASDAFSTVASWFPLVLTLCVSLFAFSTMMTWSYYGERAWTHLFKGKAIPVYQLMFVSATFIGGVNTLGVVMDFSDILFLAMAIPNLVGAYLLSGILAREVNDYCRRLKSGEFQKH